MRFALILATAILAAQAEFTAQWQVKLGVTTARHQGNFGGIAGATTLCNMNQNEPWYPILSDSSGMNPDVLDQLLDKEDDQVIIRSPSGALLPYAFATGFRVQQFFIVGMPDNFMMSIEGGVDIDEVWSGFGGNHCLNWSTNSSMETGAATNPQMPLTESYDCDISLPILCMSNVTLYDGVDPDPYLVKLAITNEGYTGDLGGPSGADAICEDEAGESGWKALLYNATNLNIITIENFPTNLLISRWDWIDGRNFHTHLASRNFYAQLFAFLVENEDWTPFVDRASSFAESIIPFGSFIRFFVKDKSDDFTCEDYTSTTNQSVAFGWNETNPITLEGTDCSVPLPFICYSQVQENNVETPKYQIASSDELTSGDISDLDSFCGGDYSVLISLDGTVVPHPFGNNNEPIEIYDYDGERVGKTFEPSTLLNATIITGHKFKTVNGDVISASNYTIGDPYFSCSDWTDGDGATQVVVFEAGETSSRLLLGTCANVNRVLCIRPYNTGGGYDMVYIGLLFLFLLLLVLAVILTIIFNR